MALPRGVHPGQLLPMSQPGCLGLARTGDQERLGRDWDQDGMGWAGRLIGNIRQKVPFVVIESIKPSTQTWLRSAAKMPSSWIPPGPVFHITDRGQSEQNEP